MITCIDNTPHSWFPDTNEALENGLLCFGGELSVTRLLAAYQRGIYPCPAQGLPMLWWTTNPRLVLQPSKFYVGRTLGKELRRYAWQVSSDRCFSQVVQACAARNSEGNWITSDISNAYTKLHQLGYAHSIEVWLNGEMCAGLYGVALGGVFFGESVFTTRPNAGKVALHACAKLLVDMGYALIDCQMESPLLRSVGARLISRKAFERILAQHIYNSQVKWLDTMQPFNLSKLVNHATMP